MKLIHTTAKIIKISLEVLLLGLGLTIGVVWVLGRFNIIAPISAYVVLSGSMSPIIPTGSVVFVAPKPFGYRVGDIVTYTHGGQEFTTHRVANLVDENSQIGYTTKGDANNSEDPGSIPKASIKGSVILTVPYLGYAVSFAKKPYGFILLVIIPATIIIYEEIKTIGRETKQIVVKKKSKKSSGQPGGAGNSPKPKTALPHINFVPHYSSAGVATLHADHLHRVAHPVVNLPQREIPDVPPPPKARKRYNAPVPPTKSSLNQRLFMPIKSGGFIRLSVILPLAAALTVLVGVSGAFFIDRETSSQNVLGAGTWAEPLATPTPLIELDPVIATESGSPN